MRKIKQEVDTIRYTPMVDEGLTSAQVDERLEQGLRNVVRKNTQI